MQKTSVRAIEMRGEPTQEISNFSLTSTPILREELIESFGFSAYLYDMAVSDGVLKATYRDDLDPAIRIRCHNLSDIIEFHVSLALGWPIRPAYRVADEAEEVSDLIFAAWEEACDSIRTCRNADAHRDLAYIFAASAMAVSRIEWMSFQRRMCIISSLGRMLGVRVVEALNQECAEGQFHPILVC
jgi:hypothetical protein